MESQPMPVPPISSRPWRIAKLVLHIASLVFCIITIGLSAGLETEGLGPGTATLAVTVVAAVWSIAELVTLFVQRRRGSLGRGIHPGAHVGVHLIIFLVLIFALFASCLVWRSVLRFRTMCNEWERDPDNPDWVMQITRDDDGFSGTSFWCPDSYREIINSSSYYSSIQAITVFSALLCVIHFTLFIRACVETYRRNRSRSAAVGYPQQQMAPAPYGGNDHPTHVPQGGPGQTQMKGSYYA